MVMPKRVKDLLAAGGAIRVSHSKDGVRIKATHGGRTLTEVEARTEPSAQKALAKVLTCLADVPKPRKRPAKRKAPARKAPPKRRTTKRRTTKKATKKKTTKRRTRR